MRRTVQAPPVAAKLPEWMTPRPPEEQLAEFLDVWRREVPQLELEPYLTRIRALDVPTRQRITDLIEMLEVRPFAALNKDEAARKKVVTDAVLALRRMPEAWDVLVLSLVRSEWPAVCAASEVLAQVRYAPARPALFELLFRPTFHIPECLVDAMLSFGPVADAILDRAIAGIDASSASHNMAHLLRQLHAMPRAVDALIARIDRDPFIAGCAAIAIQRSGRRLAGEIPRLKRLLQTDKDEGVRSGIAEALAAMGEPEGKRYLLRTQRAFDRNVDPDESL